MVVQLGRDLRFTQPAELLALYRNSGLGLPIILLIVSKESAHEPEDSHCGSELMAI